MNSNNEEQNGKKEQNFIQEIFADAFDLKYGFPQTIWMLFRNPKKVINSYVGKEKSHYYSPYKYLMLAVALATLVFFLAIDFEGFWTETLQVQMDKQVIEDENKRQITEKIVQKYIYIMEKLKNQYGSIVTLVVWLPSYSLFSFLFFKERLKRLSNHFAMNAYIIGQVNVIQTILVFPLFFLNISRQGLSNCMDGFLLFQMIYIIYAYLRMFNNKKILTIFKTIMAPILSQLMVFAVIYLVTLVTASIMVWIEIK